MKANRREREKDCRVGRSRHSRFYEQRLDVDGDKRKEMGEMAWTRQWPRAKRMVSPGHTELRVAARISRMELRGGLEAKGAIQ